jgi:hypothetical protein
MMNNYDERYEFRIANIDDIDAIMQFIDVHWKQGHIMATNRSFFEYEFLEKDGTVNFVLAIDKNTGSIECLNGFLKASHDQEHMDIWGSIWKVLDGNMGMLGAELIRRRRELTNCRCDLDVGDDPKTAVPVLKVLLKRYTVKMKHYYMLAERDDFKIAKIAHFPDSDVGNINYNVVKLNTIDDVKQRFQAEKYIKYTPYKDYWYIDHRFLSHPIYKYELYGIEKDGEVDAIIVFRHQEYQGRVAIRFVDYIGDRGLIVGIGSFCRDIIRADERIEYMDFYCAGIDENNITDAGFSILSDDDTNIIPNYFGPFLQENIDIWADSLCKDSLFTKADADQDRPNVV